VRVEGLSRYESSEGYTLSARMGGLEVWFALPGRTPPAVRVDPFVPAALLVAMSRGELLEVDPDTPVSTRLLEGVSRAQDVLHAWNPQLVRVPVRAASAPAAPQRPEIASFLSCGVDSFYTLQKHGDDISRLILVQGLEISLRNTALFQQAQGAVRTLAQETGRRDVVVRTNARELADAFHLDIYLFHGALLAGVALALGHARTLVPASWTYAQMVPWGTHPLLDPLWSTESCELVHDGAEAGRIEKLEAIAQWDRAMRLLRVCLADTGAYNCGRCEKCLRTMVALHLLGARCPTFPRLPSIAALRRMAVDPGGSDLRENIALAERVGDRAIAEALRACLRRQQLRDLVRDADALLLGGLVKRTLRQFRRQPQRAPLIGCLPPEGS
jgi:hypothetical protein